MLAKLNSSAMQRSLLKPPFLFNSSLDTGVNPVLFKDFQPREYKVSEGLTLKTMFGKPDIFQTL
jgi:hypothetical protein